MKLLAVLIALFIATPALAVDTFYLGPNHTFAWDAATYLEDGTVVEGATYKVHIKNIVTGTEIQIGETTQLSLAVVLPAKGSYRFGIQAQLGEEITGINWSDIAANCYQGNTFAARWGTPKVPLNFKHQ